MSVDAVEAGTLERFLVERAEVVAARDGTVELATTAHRHPWPEGPFPPPPDAADSRAGRLRVDAVGEAAVRLRYAADGVPRDGGRHMIVGHLPAPASPAIEITDGLVTICTDGMRVTIGLDPYGMNVADASGDHRVRLGGPDPNYFQVADSLGTGVSVDTADGRPVATETFGIRPGHAVYGFGEGFLGLDKTGQTLDLWVRDAMGAHTPRVYKAVPFFVTTGGAGVFIHTSARVRAWVGSRSAHEVQVAVDDDVLDVFVFLGSIRHVLAQYTALTGRAPMPPDWSFGWWQSRCSYASEEQALEAVDGMRAAGFPMDVIHLDTAWFATDWRCDLEFAPDRFPDPAGFCRRLAERGVHLSLWQTPFLVGGTRLHDRLADAGGFVRDARGGFLDVGIHFVQGYDGPVHCVDWTNPAAVAVMREEYGRLLREGASVIKVDFGEEVPPDAVVADGTPGPHMHNLYPLRYQEAVHEATELVTGERISWNRSAWAGAQRYPVHWGGDVPSTWEMMLPQLYGGLSLGLSGFTFWSADIGGTEQVPEDGELPVRWLQWAVLLSHPRIHGMGDREPFRWSEPWGGIARDWILLRYRLLPYLLAMARRSAAAGLPFARPLVLEFAQDPTTWRIGDQFLCGESLMVAPLFEPGGRRTVYLPSGRWIDWWTREPVAGGRWVDVRHEPATAPLYLRAGAIVPMGPVQRWVGERPTDPLTILLAPLEGDGVSELVVPVDGRDVLVRYVSDGGRHVLEVGTTPGEVVVDVAGPEAVIVSRGRS